MLALVGPVEGQHLSMIGSLQHPGTYKLDSNTLAHELLVVKLGDSLHGVFVGLHHYETKASRLLGVRIVHDGRLVNLADIV